MKQPETNTKKKKKKKKKTEKKKKKNVESTAMYTDGLKIDPVCCH